MEIVRSRRAFLLGTAGGMGALTLLQPHKAHALSTEPIGPGTSLGIAIANRCGSDAEHAAIRASLAARLAAQPLVAGQPSVLAAVCPVCGCPIYASR